MNGYFGYPNARKYDLESDYKSKSMIYGYPVQQTALLIPLNGINNVIAFGDSFTAGLNASTTANRFVNRFTDKYGFSLNNQGAGGRGIWVAVANTQTQVYTKSQTIVLCMVGLNDIRRGIGQKTKNKIYTGIRTFISQQLIKSQVASGDSTVTRSGTISATNAQSIGGTYSTGAIPGNTSTFSATAGDSWTWSFTGTGVGVQFVISDGVFVTYGEADIFIDGSFKRRVKLNNLMDGITDGTYDNARGVMAVNFFGLPNTSHTIRVVHRGGGNVLIDKFMTYFDANKEKSQVARTVISEIPYVVGDGYWKTASGTDKAQQRHLDEVNKEIHKIVMEFARMGYPIYFNPTNTGYNKSGVDTDSVHPIDYGHLLLFRQLDSCFTRGIIK